MISVQSNIRLKKYTKAIEASLDCPTWTKLVYYNYSVEHPTAMICIKCSHRWNQHATYETAFVYYYEDLKIIEQCPKCNQLSGIVAELF